MEQDSHSTKKSKAKARRQEISFPQPALDAVSEQGLHFLTPLLVAWPRLAFWMPCLKHSLPYLPRVGVALVWQRSPEWSAVRLFCLVRPLWPMPLRMKHSCQFPFAKMPMTREVTRQPVQTLKNRGRQRRAFRILDSEQN